MTKFTIVYSDGHEEHYNVIQTKEVESSMRLKRFREIIEDGMLKLLIEDKQVVLIPVINIRKIIAHADDVFHLKTTDFPGFMHVEETNQESK